VTESVVKLPTDVSIAMEAGPIQIARAETSVKKEIEQLL